MEIRKQPSKGAKNIMNQAEGINKEEDRKALTDNELEQASGGYMLWGRTCKICGGVINNDPNTPDDIRCHCNEDSTQSWVPRPH